MMPNQVNTSRGAQKRQQNAVQMEEIKWQTEQYSKFNETNKQTNMLMQAAEVARVAATAAVENRKRNDELTL